MAVNSVARSKRLSSEVLTVTSGSLETTITLEEVRIQAAALLAAGFDSRKVSRAMVKYLSESGNEQSAYRRLRRWMKRDASFRDLIFQQAVVRLDLDSPQILGGISKAAKRGRVDAARLALEITGRHTKDDAPVTAVQIVLNNVARPEA